MTRETVGKVATDLLLKAGNDDHSVDEQMSEQLKDYEQNVQQAIKEGLKEYKNSFYVVVLTKKERIMANVLRNYFFTRSTCPTPEWDQAVYRYHPASGDVEFLWVLPAKDICNYLIENALTIDKSERELLDFVLSFTNGSLLRLAKKLNGEMDESPLLA